MTVYVRLKDHTTLNPYVRLNVLTTVSICQVEGLYDFMSTCQVEGMPPKRLRIHKVSCAQKSERSCLETLHTKGEYTRRFTMPLVYFSSSVLCFFKLRIS